jgi:hypothetical protein
MQLEHWCPQAQKMTKLTLEAVHKTRLGLEAGTVTACQDQQQCRNFRRGSCLIDKTLEGRFG